jgi:hypothetical protein
MLSGGNNDNHRKNEDEPEGISEKDLDQIRKSFRTKRIALDTMLQEFAKHASNATNDFDRITNKSLVIDAKLIRNLTVWIEMLVIENIGLKKQIDILKDIVVQLREVKGNPEMMEDIEKAFRDYNRSNI